MPAWQVMALAALLPGAGTLGTIWLAYDAARLVRLVRTGRL